MISFGVLLVQERPIHEVIEWGRRFDEAGVDSVWVTDLLAHPREDVNPFWYDGWTALAVLAHVTSRCRVGPLVSNFVLHSPMRLARLTKTLDAISEGRLDLGLGMGGAAICRSLCGVLDDGPALADRFENGLESLVKILDGGSTQLVEVPVIAGRSGAPPSVVVSTPSVQAPRPPIVVGGHGPRVIDIAARLADRWNVFDPPGVTSPGDIEGALKRLITRFDERCAVHGRTGQVPRSILIDTAPGLQPTTRQELADLVARMSDLGYDEVIAGGWPTEGSSVRSIEELLAFVAEDLPGLR